MWGRRSKPKHTQYSTQEIKDLLCLLALLVRMPSNQEIVETAPERIDRAIDKLLGMSNLTYRDDGSLKGARTEPFEII